MRIGRVSGVLAACVLVWTASGCAPAPAASPEEIEQQLHELRADVDALKRTVARLEQELAEARATSKPAAPAAKTSAAAVQPKTQAAQCDGKTRAGARCKRSASQGSRYCWQHGGN
ncbi:MAG: hypothetical protein H6509_13790 [Bryobacterales bacterium]|nr:hypothetical protein [Acidobacteriota bacterium]MCB9385682.1 hypothetical protein [Bryobacterales bacterium]